MHKLVSEWKMMRDVLELCRLWMLVDDATKRATLEALRHSTPEREWQEIVVKRMAIIE